MEKREEIKYILKMLETNKISAKEAGELIKTLEVDKTSEKAEYSAINDVISNMAEMSKKLGKLGAKIGKEIIDGISEFDFEVEHYKIDKYKFKMNDNCNIKVDINGKINFYSKNSNDNEIEIIASYKEKNRSKLAEYLKIVSYPDNLDIMLKKEYKKIVNIDIHIPHLFLNSVVAISKNNKVTFEGLKANSIDIITTNGRIEGNKTISEILNIATINGLIKVTNCKGEQLKVINSNAHNELINNDFYKSISSTSTNGNISSSKLFSNKISLMTTNGNIGILNSRCNFLKLLTSNGKLSIKKVDSKENKSCDIEAVTSNGNIDCYCNAKFGILFDVKADNGKINLIGKGIKADEKIVENEKMIKAIGKSKIGSMGLKYNNLQLRTSMGQINIDWD